MKRTILFFLISVVSGQCAFSQLSVTIGNINYEMCGHANGSAKAFPAGGVSPYTYLWNTAPPQTTQAATNLAAGNYTVTVTDNAASTASASVTIGEIAGPSCSITNFQNETNGQGNGLATVTASGGTPPYTYYWSNSQSLPTAINLSAGEYGVIVTDANGCTCGDTVIIINVVGINETTQESGYFIYPNPTNGSVTLKFDNSNEKDFTIETYDIIGNMVYSEANLSLNNKSENIIHLDFLPKGIYYLKYISEEKIFTRKIVLE